MAVRGPRLLVYPVCGAVLVPPLGRDSHVWLSFMLFRTVRPRPYFPIVTKVMQCVLETLLERKNCVVFCQL